MLASIPVCSLLADNRAMLLRIAAVDTEEKWDSFLALAAPAACASKVRFVLLFFFIRPRSLQPESSEQSWVPLCERSERDPAVLIFLSCQLQHDAIARGAA